jgi:hypothetical protein
VARFYSNENFPLPIVLELRRLGHDVMTSHEAGQANQQIPDSDVVAFATSAGRAVLTLNRKHFRQEHRRFPAHAGIVISTTDLDYVALARRIDARMHSLADLSGLLISVTKAG